MTMRELKPIAAVTFNGLVSDVSAQTYFADAFDLWENSESLYDGSNNAYKAIIRRYAQPINIEIARMAAVTATGYTKRTTSANDETGKESSSSDKIMDSTSKRSATGTDNTTASDESKKTIKNTGAVTRTETDGEFTQTARTYPQGFISAPDASYIASQTMDSPYTQTDKTDTDTASNEDTDATRKTDTNTSSDDNTATMGKEELTASKDTTRRGTADAEEVDALARAAQLIAYSPVLSGLIESLVFRFVAHTSSGGLKTLC